jgi:hypothetical protein
MADGLHAYVREAPSLMAEHRALGVLMLSPNPGALVTEHSLTEELFSEPSTREVFEAVLRVAARTGGRPELVDIAADLERRGQLVSVGGIETLRQFPLTVESTRSLPRDVQTMRESRQQDRARRALQAALDGIDGDGFAPALDAAIDELHAVRAGAGSATGRFAIVPVADVGQVELPPPGFWWQDYLPAGVITLLGAHGGTGKSMLALMLAVCVATGRPLFGVETRLGIVAYFSGEDPAETLRHRLAWICNHLNIDPAELEGRLFLLDATITNPVLFAEVTAAGRRYGETTTAYSELRAFVAARAVDVLIVDNASDTFDANEIDRAKVRAFMRALARIAQDRAGAVLLLAHVDKGTSRGERSGSEGYSGSTAWHNSARSRLYLAREKDGSLRLEHQKANLGRQREPVALEWPHGGLPQPLQATQPVVQAISDRNDTRVLLRLIHEFTLRGEHVSTATTSRTHAGRLLRGQPGFPPNLADPDLFDLLRAAERHGLLARTTFKGADRKSRERWEVTPAGRESAGLAATAATSRDFQVTAHPEVAAEPAATAATSPLGGVGEKSAHKTGAGVTA